jgi:osmotically-inducible protein OsmY
LFALVLAACGAAASGTHDDMTISTRVKIVLLDDPQLGAFRIDARTFHGVVTLSGTVQSPAQERRAIAAARKVRGVKDVKSEIKVAPAVPKLAVRRSPVFGADLFARKTE